jgi:hypothetical protein
VSHLALTLACGRSDPRLPDGVRTYARSLQAHWTHRRACLYWDLDDGLIADLAATGLEMVPVPPQPGHCCKARWGLYRDYLATASCDLVVIMDARDAVLQRDPTPDLLKVCFDGRGFVGFVSEGQTVGSDTWAVTTSRAVESNASTAYRFDHTLDSINGGTLVGTRAEVARACHLIQCACLPRDGGYEDMWALNYAYRAGGMVEPHWVEFDPRRDHLCVHAGAWWRAGMSPPPGVTLDGKRVSRDGIDYAIVHQWDRLP